jgi:DNA-binding NtrC family response regulator
MYISTFLIVDDNLAIVDMYKDVLALKGHEILGVAKDGRECMIKLNEYTILPDFVILDYRMALGDGLTVMKEVLKDKPNLKVIFTSGDESISAEAQAAGAAMFLKKPFPLNALYQGIEKLTKQ